MVLYIVDGWNSENSYLLGRDVLDMMPVLSTEYLNDTQRSTYQKAILDFDTSPQAFKRAIMTGHVPGMIELPEY